MVRVRGEEEKPVGKAYMPHNLEGGDLGWVPDPIRGFLFSGNFDKISMSQEKT
jgi:hypothetical protein